MTDAEIQALLDAASPGPWHHVNPGMVSPKTRTIHGTVPAEPVDYVSTWPGLGTPPGHRVVIPRDVGVRSDDMALIAEAPTLAAEVLTLRAGSAASAERIKELEARVAELTEEVEDLRATNEALALPEGSVLITSFDWSEVAEARVEELEAALAKANEPHWYYSEEEGSAWWSLEEALEQVTDDIRDLYHAEDMPRNHLVGIETSRPCPTIWGVLQLLANDEVEARGCKDPWVFTPCATEAEARALLKESE